MDKKAPCSIAEGFSNLRWLVFFRLMLRSIQAACGGFLFALDRPHDGAGVDIKDCLATWAGY